ncbi:MAG TPA: BTAD domain-containing putative transcriptional regulator [Longimicrobiales bacterium]
MLKLRLLGNAGLESESSGIAARAVQPRRLALLAILGLAPRRSVSRDKLVALLWPESDSEQARHLLSVAIYELRKALGDTVVTTARDDVSLSPDVLVDVAQFEQAIATSDYQAAIDIYAGPFLDGFHISDAPDFERWVDGERSYFARRYAESLEKLAHQHAHHGDHAAALQAWRKLVAHDPYNARAVCGLMLSLEASGDRAGALQQARAHAALLHEEFGAQPDADVEALAARLRSSPGDARASVAPLPSRPASAALLPPTSAPYKKKHIATGLVLLTALVAVLIVWQVRKGGARGGVPPEIPKIAVLPFDNVSARDSVYFGDGLSAEIIHVLGRIPNIRVADRNSSFRFRGPHDVRDVARTLSVNHVLTGTVRMTPERIRVTAELVDARDNLQVWSDDYDLERQIADVISIQQDIASAVVNALRQRFNQNVARAPTPARPTDDLQAWEWFVRGSHFYHRRTVPDLQRALQYFDSAIARDPNYALAHASRAEVYALLGAYDYGAMPPKIAFAQARASAERALSIDPNSAEAHNALGAVLFNYEWDWPEAEAEFQQAIRLSPGYGLAHHWYSLLLHCSGRRREALQAIMRAREVDPLSPVIATAVARHHYLARQFDAALAAHRRTIDTDSTFVTARVALGLTLAARGDYRAAVEQYQIAGRLLGMRAPIVDALIANAYGRANMRDRALPYVRNLEMESRRRYVPAEYLAVAYIGTGNLDAAFAALDQAFANRSAGMAYLEIEPLVDPLKNDPRYARYVRKIRSARK